MSQIANTPGHHLDPVKRRWVRDEEGAARKAAEHLQAIHDAVRAHKSASTEHERMDALAKLSQLLRAPGSLPPKFILPGTEKVAKKFTEAARAWGVMHKGVRYAVHSSLVAPEAWVDDGYGGRELRPMRKGNAPPAGYTPIPGSKHGGYRRRQGAGWDYWYPSKDHAARDAEHHIGKLDELGFPGMAEELRADPDPSALRYHHQDVDRAHADDDRGKAAPFRQAHAHLDHIAGAWAAMRKSAPAEKSQVRAALGGGMQAGAVSFDVGEYLFTFRKASTGLPILTVRGGRLPLPYHMVVRGIEDARRRAPAVARDFDAGRVPEEGVFRRDDDDAVRVRFTDRTQA